MTSWNHSPSDANPPNLTNLENGSGEYSDSGRTRTRVLDWFLACGALLMFTGAGVLAVILALIDILSKGRW